MTKPYIVGNWKMNTTLDEAVALAEACSDIAQEVRESVDVGICPPFPWIVPISNAIFDEALRIGAQDCAAAEKGAYTGDVSASMLSGLCSFTLIGHSERRTHHDETDEIIQKKIGLALKARLHVILCVGETSEEREAGQAQSVVQRQLDEALLDVDGDDAPRLTIAYEPVWAIGTGVAATEDDASEMATMIRENLKLRFGFLHGTVRILYGGSANESNAASFLAASNVDGLLVGSASLSAASFATMIRAAYESASRKR